MKHTKKSFLALAKMLDVEVEIEPKDVWGEIHIHAYAPHRKVFNGLGTHNINLGNFDRLKDVDWNFLAGEIQLEDCDPESCEAECWDEAKGGS